MSSVILKASESTLNEIGGQGKWWLPASPDKTVTGILTYTPNAGGILEILGSLEPIAGTEFDSIVFGKIKGKLYTLDHGFRTQTHDAFFGPPSEETWICTTIFRGAHLTAGSLTIISSCEIETKLFQGWVHRPRPQITSRTRTKLRASIETPSSLTANLVNGRSLAFQWRRSYNVGLLEVSAAITPLMRITQVNENLYWIHDELITPLIYMISFCMGSPDHVSRLRITIEDHESDTVVPIEVFEMRSSSSNERNVPRSPHEHMIQLSEFETRFEDFINDWFSLYSGSKYAFMDYFATMVNEGMYVEEMFLRIIRSLESWHTDHNGGLKSSDYSTMQGILKSMKAVLPSHDLKLIRDKLDQFNGPSLRERLVALINDTETDLRTFLLSKKDFVVLCLATRNRFTHHSTKRKAFEGEDLYWAEQFLAAIFVCEVMAKLSLSQVEIHRNFQRSRFGRLINSKIQKTGP